METFLYSLAASAIVAITVVAYSKPSAYMNNWYARLWNITAFFILMFLSIGVLELYSSLMIIRDTVADGGLKYTAKDISSAALSKCHLYLLYVGLSFAAMVYVNFLTQLPVLMRETDWQDR